MKFGKLILRKIVKIFATILCHILKLKCNKFDFGWGSAPDPAGGAYSAPPDLLAVRKGRGERTEGKSKRGEGTYFYGDWEWRQETRETGKGEREC